MASRTKRRNRPVAAGAIAATPAVAAEWRRRIAAEYGSAAITQHLVLWLIQMGASPDLVRDGLRIVGDELDHAELSREVWQAAGGTGAPTLDRDALGLTRRHPTLELDVGAVVGRVFCLGETVAVPLFQNLRRGATVAVSRRAPSTASCATRSVIANSAGPRWNGCWSSRAGSRSAPWSSARSAAGWPSSSAATETTWWPRCPRPAGR